MDTESPQIDTFFLRTGNRLLYCERTTFATAGELGRMTDALGTGAAHVYFIRCASCPWVKMCATGRTFAVGSYFFFLLM